MMHLTAAVSAAAAVSDSQKGRSLLQGMNVGFLGNAPPIITMTPSNMGINCREPVGVLHVGGDANVDGRVIATGGIRLTQDRPHLQGPYINQQQKQAAPCSSPSNDTTITMSRKDIVLEIQTRVDAIMDRLALRMEELVKREVEERALRIMDAATTTSSRNMQNESVSTTTGDDRQMTIEMADARYVSHDGLRAQNFITTQRAAALFEKKKS